MDLWHTQSYSALAVVLKLDQALEHIRIVKVFVLPQSALFLRQSGTFIEFVEIVQTIFAQNCVHHATALTTEGFLVERYRSVTTRISTMKTRLAVHYFLLYCFILKHFVKLALERSSIGDGHHPKK